MLAYGLRRNVELIIALDCRRESLSRERERENEREREERMFAAVQFADWRPYH